MNILFGTDRDTRQPVKFPSKALQRHLHLIGYSGSGKTTALVTLLIGLFLNPFNKQCIFIIDRLGGFSFDLLRWFSSSFCPNWVRERLLYIQPSMEDIIVPMNPLLYATPGEGYYRTARATEIVLRGWASQDIQQMPRLARWLFNSFWAVAQLGLCIGDCLHLLRPQSQLHRLLINVLPESLRWEWQQILQTHQAETQLESCRNRLTPFFESPFLRAMFSSTKNYLNVLEWMRGRKIVILNLAPHGKVPDTMADTIGGLTVNEIFSVARSLPPQDRVETLVVLDEFQRFVGPDLEMSLAESRQLKTPLLLSHQSFDQLQRGNDVDLTSLILQAQSRLILNVQGKDADFLAEEIAAFTFDGRKLKDEIWHRCQRVSGHRIIDLQSQAHSEQFAKQWNDTHGTQASTSRNTVYRNGRLEDVTGHGISSADTRSSGSGGSAGHGSTFGTHQSVLPIYEEYMELANKTYETFDDQKHEWGRKLRRQKRGQGVLRIVDDDHLYNLAVKKTSPGHLGLPWETIVKKMPQVVDAYHLLLEKNFQQACFMTPAVIEKETEQRLANVLRAPIRLVSEFVAKQNQSAEEPPPAPDDSLPFSK